MNIVLLTRIKPVADTILENLKRRNIAVKAIFIEKRRVGGLLRRARNVYRHRGLILLFKEIFIVLSNKVRRPNTEKISYYKTYCTDVFFFDDLNSSDCIEKMKEVSPDIAVLAGTGIIKSELLNTVKLFFLNAHPGLLPYYRGIDVIPACILNGDKPCVTVHKVDSGVDTGKILDTKEIPIEEGDTLSSLQNKSIEIAGELISEVIYKIINNIPIAEKNNPKELGKQYYMMNSKQLKEAGKALKKLTGAK